MPRKRKEHSNTFFHAFPSRLRKVMERQGTTQQDLANHLGLSRQAVSAYCDGTSSPDWRTLAKIGPYFGVSTDYLLGLTDNATVVPEVQAVCQYTGLSQEAVEALHGTNGDPGMGSLRVFNAILTHPEASVLMENAWKAVAMDKISDDQKTACLQAVGFPQTGWTAQTVQDLGQKILAAQAILQGGGYFILTQEEVAEHYRQAAGKTLQDILKDIGRE